LRSRWTLRRSCIRSGRQRRARREARKKEEGEEKQQEKKGELWVHAVLRYDPSGKACVDLNRSVL
jgi:hypothetical protein